MNESSDLAEHIDPPEAQESTFAYGFDSAKGSSG
jgi:hypothetical protein